MVDFPKTFTERGRKQLKSGGWNKAIGSAGEDLACRYLAEKGYEILERSFRCRSGEIDVIAMKNGEMAFVEVKTRTGRVFGYPADAVDNTKLARMKKCAEYYLMMTERICDSVRLDVIEVEIRHIQRVYR